MRPRVLAVSGVLGIVAFAATAPALAHNPTVQVDLDPDPVPAGVYETAAPTVKGNASHTGTLQPDLDKVELTWSSPNLSAGCTLPPAETFPAGSDRLTFTSSATFDCNGRYEVTAKAYSQSQAVPAHEQTTATKPAEFGLRLPPAVPTGVAATPNNANRTVKVSWTANTEPDLDRYLVWRRIGGGPWLVIDDAYTAAYTDSDIADAGGSYSYRIESVRLGVEQNPANNQDKVFSVTPSAVSTASVSAVPTTTTAEGGTTTTSSGSTTTTSGGASQPATTTTSAYTVPRTPPATNAPPVRDLSGFEELKARAEEEARRRSTTTDPGYDEDLPFGSRQGPTDGSDDGSLASGPRDRSTFESVTDRTETLIPIAGGLVLFVGALQLRYLARRAAQPDADGAFVDIDEGPLSDQ